MNKCLYILRVLSGARFKKLFGVIRYVHEKSGKSKVYIFFDIIKCALRYGAGYYDYQIFAFWNMNREQRKTYVTRLWNKKLIMLLNDQNYSHIFNNKNEFCERFRDYLGREFIDLTRPVSREEFAEFYQKHDVMFAKPQVGECGKGIEKLHTADFASADEMYDYVTDGKFGLIEQSLTQHEALNTLYPLAINSLRIVTLVANGEAHLVYAVSKMGNAGKFVDNMENSGLACPLDPETGEIVGVAHTSSLETYEVHPYTHVKLRGYVVPFVAEAVELCKKAALEVEQIKFVGWDVCITPDGPAIIEGNDYPGYDFWQLPEHTPDKIGLLPYYKKMVPELK